MGYSSLALAHEREHIVNAQDTRLAHMDLMIGPSFRAKRKRERDRERGKGRQEEEEERRSREGLCLSVCLCLLLLSF